MAGLDYVDLLPVVRPEYLSKQFLFIVEYYNILMPFTSQTIWK